MFIDVLKGYPLRGNAPGNARRECRFVTGRRPTTNFTAGHQRLFLGLSEAFHSAHLMPFRCLCGAFPRGGHVERIKRESTMLHVDEDAKRATEEEAREAAHEAATETAAEAAKRGG